MKRHEILERPEISRARVAYLAGTSYCGSTLLALLMDHHPQIASVGETSLHRTTQIRGVAQYPCTCGELLIRCPFWTRVFRSVSDRGLEFGATHWTNDYRYKQPLLHRTLSLYSSHEWMRRLQGLAASWLPGHRGRLRRTHAVNVEFIRAVLEITHSDVFFDTSKELMRLHHLLSIPELEVQVIRVVRDVRAFANSAKRNKKLTIEESVQNWRDYQLGVERITRGFPSDRVFLLRYEDLCQEPSYWQQQLYGFLGVEKLTPPETIIPSEHHVIGNRMRLKDSLTIRFDESWKDNLTEMEVSQIMDIAGDINQHFGYPA